MMPSFLQFPFIAPISFVNPIGIRHSPPSLNRRCRVKRSLVSSQPLCLLDYSINFPTEATSIGLSIVSSFLSVFFYRHLFSRGQPAKFSDIGEWILLSQPTPFNRFVITRCPAISLHARKSFERFSGRSKQQGNCPLPLNHGRIIISGAENEDIFEHGYQRVCVRTRDGGVISLDWPANLDLKQERELDATLLLVPGTPDGSMDADVREVVCLALQHGVFPIVMNPRGCAGSPITNSRLFTAADSDDISTAVEFVKKERPWATMFGIGWGYGGNMMTRYLAEVGEMTPLTAATCIDNLFDMEEATKSSLYSLALNKKMSGGLKDILRLNKELFQGKGKGFHVEKALMANSVRDFDKAISMVSYGFDRVEEFYSKCSVSQSIRHLRIPVLFIQSNEGSVPPHSVPRSLILGNPFTTLLSCSCEDGSNAIGGGKILSWCHKIVIEWLAAVEFTLLKRSFTLLPDATVEEDSITCSDCKIHAGSETHAELLDAFLTDVNTLNLDSTLEPFDNTYAATIHSYNNMDPRNLGHEEFLQDEINSESSRFVIASGNEPGFTVDSEKGQGEKTAQVVMNMLDVTLPNVLDEEKKEKVLEAVSRGENLLHALEEAVPVDVREKLANSVSAILQNQKTTVSTGLDSIPVSAGIKPPVRGTVEQINSLNFNKGSSSNETERISEREDGAGDSDVIREAKEIKPELDQHNHGNLDSNTVKKQVEDASLSPAKTGTISGAGSSEALKDGESTSPETTGDSVALKKESLDLPPSAELDKEDKANVNDQDQSSSPVSLPNTNEKGREKMMEQIPKNAVQSEPGSSNSFTPGFNVVQALDALSGIDDSTQVAVNSVFGVIENIISEMEGKKEEHEDASSEKPLIQETDESELSTFNSTETLQSSVDEHHNALPECSKGTISRDKWNDSPLYETRTADEHNELVPINRRGVHLDLDTTASLLLDYIPEDGQWKLLERNVDADESAATRRVQKLPCVEFIFGNRASEVCHETSSCNKLSRMFDADCYVLYTDGSREFCERLGHFMQFSRRVIAHSLTSASISKMGATEFRQIKSFLREDIEELATAASFAMLKHSDCLSPSHDEDVSRCFETRKVGILCGDRALTALATAYWETRYLKRILPVGVVIGSSMTALRKHLNVKTELYNLPQESFVHLNQESPVENGSDSNKCDDCTVSPQVDEESSTNDETKGVMVGAVTAALGASALLMQQQDSSKNSTKSVEESGNDLKAVGSNEENSFEGNQGSLVTSLAEKAMQVAAPVVPTTEDGEVDQERLVAMLADLGKKGGALRLVGKLALLWGGIRGAMSLTDKLIMFLRMADRPLYLRVVGFTGMILVLWSPVIIPFIPSLVQSWINKTSVPFAELVCILGLYAAVMILVMMWGRRIRGHDDPFKQYGLHISNQVLIKGFFGGVLLVFSIQAANTQLGFASFRLPSILPLLSVFTRLEVYKEALMMAGRAIVTLGVVLVEELLFRSWLPDEIAADLGLYKAIIASGLVFSLIDRSWLFGNPLAVPGRWLLSLVLSLSREWCDGNLSICIGLRTGILSSNFLLRDCGFFYRSSLPVWMTGNFRHPEDGVVGLAFSAILSLSLFLTLSRKELRNNG